MALISCLDFTLNPGAHCSDVLALPRWCLLFAVGQHQLWSTTWTCPQLLHECISCQNGRKCNAPGHGRVLILFFILKAMQINRGCPYFFKTAEEWLERNLFFPKGLGFFFRNEEKGKKYKTNVLTHLSAVH